MKTADNELERLKQELQIGAKVIYDDEDPADPMSIGTVVEPTNEELNTARQEWCGFEEDPSEYILILWADTDAPQEDTYREWEFIGNLRLAQDTGEKSNA